MDHTGPQSWMPFVQAFVLQYEHEKSERLLLKQSMRQGLQLKQRILMMILRLEMDSAKF